MDKLIVSTDTLELNPELAGILRVKGQRKRESKRPIFNGSVMGSENEEQAALFQWRDMVAGVLPELAMLHAIPNGQYRSGQRMEPGLMAGIPDICLPFPSQGWHGFYGELKVGNNTTSSEQDAVIRNLRNNGYFVVVKYGWVAMAKSLLDYLQRTDITID